VALRTQARRVKVLENGSGGGGDGCPRCGWGGDNDGTFELVFEDDSAVEEEEMEEEIFCSECGTQLTIFFDDDVRAP
jgi:hypothetical protein